MIRLREEMFWYYSMQVAGVVFQACSFNHSDISPFDAFDFAQRRPELAEGRFTAFAQGRPLEIHELRAVSHLSILQSPFTRIRFNMLRVANILATCIRVSKRNIVKGLVHVA